MNPVFWPFQEVVNTYGIPNYKEVNPGYFTIITFPFLFGVMFGDAGHGGIILCFAIFLVMFSDYIKKYIPSLSGLLVIKYLLLLMGIFATFNGIIYNDFMSLPMTLFGESCYFNEELIDEDCVYPVGIDPAWFKSKNKIAFMNSLKMKISVILGVCHMGMGVCLKGKNAKYFKRDMDYYHEFVP
jgi:V-type H+-transporting ATPase subunit a